MSIETLDRIVRDQKRGQSRGIASICSSHPYVLKAAMQRASRAGRLLLVESTCNQVNQFGGYTGLTPAAFVEYLKRSVQEAGMPQENLLLGGDHLGPSVWQEEPSASAMPKAIDLVRAYVRQGYVKIHLDASMKLADDDPSGPLDLELAAARTASLAKAAEQAAAERGEGIAPRYVIGTEVPIPGGAQVHEDSLQPTTAAEVQRTIEVTRAAFLQNGLEAAWERVQAVVVQPGVEFGDDFVIDYQPASAAELVRFIEAQPGLVYEAHSTDYQTPQNLALLVRDHFTILKVGPALTFAFREAAYALAWMEAELVPAAERSELIGALEQAMLRDPRHWKKHYHGTPAEQAFARHYSLSDRARYYWPEPGVQAAFEHLLQNLSRRPLPLTLLSQFAPRQYEHIRAGSIRNTPEAVILDRIDQVLEDYTRACEG